MAKHKNPNNTSGRSLFRANTNSSYKEYRTIHLPLKVTMNTSNTTIKPMKFGRTQVGNPLAPVKRRSVKQPVTGGSS